MQRFSIFTLARNALTRHRDLEPHWRRAAPRGRYEVVIVGAGGHGLATAYHLARDHGIRDTAVLAAGVVGADALCGAGHVASDHPDAAFAALLEGALRRYHTLSRELNFNVKFAPRGHARLALDDGEADYLRRVVEANRMGGIDTRFLAPERVRRLAPGLAADGNAAAPLRAAAWQPAGGTAHRGAVAWAYARAADSLGVDLVENCPVTAVVMQRGRAVGVETPAGRIGADRVVLAAAAGTAGLAQGAGLVLPLAERRRHILVSEPARPLLGVALAVPAFGLALHQEDSGEIVIQATRPGPAALPEPATLDAAAAAARAATRLMPALSGLRILRRETHRDVTTPDGLPLVGATARPRLYVSSGWGARSFTAIPAAGEALARMVAGAPAPDEIAPFAGDRFADAAGAGAPA